jgi:transcriptional regulator with XRE-family HTH domain
LDKLNHVIAENLKKLREERKLSLDHVARLSGVSKSMIGQIERGEVNPTVSTIWKLANGLKISFTQLMSRPEADIELVDQSDIQPLIEDQGRFRNYPVFPFDSERRFEMYLLEIDRGGSLDAETHPQGAQEFITVFSGELTVTTDNRNFIVKKGNSIRFKADGPHSYRNSSHEICSLSMVIYYPI